MQHDEVSSAHGCFVKIWDEMAIAPSVLRQQLNLRARLPASPVLRRLAVEFRSVGVTCHQVRVVLALLRCAVR